MTDPSPHCCSTLEAHIGNEDVPLVYVSKFREYGIELTDGGSSFIELNYCLWCGERFPESIRDTWFERLEKLGLEPGESSIPEDMENDSWWRCRQ